MIEATGRASDLGAANMALEVIRQIFTYAELRGEGVDEATAERVLNHRVGSDAQAAYD